MKQREKDGGEGQGEDIMEGREDLILPDRIPEAEEGTEEERIGDGLEGDEESEGEDPEEE